MSKSELITTIATMPDNDARLQRIAAILNGTGEDNRSGSLRLLRVCDCVRESGMSRSTWNRLIDEKRVRVVRVREGGSPRIPEDELRRIVEGAQ